mgnify:CR=1 FL=1
MKKVVGIILKNTLYYDRHLTTRYMTERESLHDAGMHKLCTNITQLASSR